MSLVTLPYSFSPGTTILSAQVNLNLTTLVNSINGGLDYTNIGAAGIRPSQLTAAAVSDSTVALGYSFTITPTSAAVTGLIVNGISAQSVDIFKVALTSGGTSAFKIGSAGVATFGFAVSMAALTSTATGSFANQVYADGASGGTAFGFHGGTGISGLVLQSHTTVSNPAVYIDALNQTTGSTTKVLRVTRNNLATDLFTVDANGQGALTSGLSLGGALTGATTGAFSGLLSANAGINLASNQALQAAGVNALFGDGTNLSLRVPNAGGSLFVQNAAASINVMQLGNTGAVTFPGLVTGVGLTAGTGTVKGASDGATNAWLPPVYTAGGAATAGTEHIARGVTASIAASSSATINLAGAAAFTSATSYFVVTGLDSSTAAILAPNITRVSGSSFTITNPSSTVATVVHWIAIGS